MNLNDPVPYHEALRRVLIQEMEDAGVPDDLVTELLNVEPYRPIDAEEMLRSKVVQWTRAWAEVVRLVDAYRGEMRYQQWANEAERGYDPDQLKPRKQE